MKILTRQNTGLLIVDVQEKLFPHIECSEMMITKLCELVQGCQILKLPIVVSEQYPKGLGDTVGYLKKILGPDQKYLSKTTFSCLRDNHVTKEMMDLPIDSWIVAGIEAHVCILQTARDLLMGKKNAVVVNDAIGSRSIYDYSSAIAELRDFGARISTTETVLFELLGDAKSAEFKEISQLIQCYTEKKSSCCCS